MSVFDHPEFDHHESVQFVDEPDSGLKAIIAIHSTALGPAAGGCRRWQYANSRDALTDVLRLSRGMTYKNAIAGLPFGGGKSVILAADSAPKSPQLFRAFGRAIESLGGRYITAEDVGIGMDDMRIVREETAFVSGLPQSGESAGGDPSPWTALGVFLGIEAAAKARLNAASLDGLRVAVQGVGHVGFHLCHLLAKAGAEVHVADVNRDNLNRIREAVDVSTESPAEILFTDVDILAPCALGNILNAQSIPRIKASVIAGAANNQLSDVADGARLTERDILFAPDYVINAGGVISVAREYLGVSSEDEVRTEVGQIPNRLIEIFDNARDNRRPTNVIADEMARRIVADAKQESPSTSGTRQIA
ncbi:MAG: Glu/Leu/Phe/Val dehydrogenase [Woeseiaceae bacterium]|nr:Glu/Leu/Phe/Val dehydrogenase [Woeseiaceae bacterium]